MRAQLLGRGPPIRPRRAQKANMKGDQREPSFLAAAHPSDPGAQKGNMKGDEDEKFEVTKAPRELARLQVSSASSFLGQEEVEQPANEDPQASGAERFSPQQVSFHVIFSRWRWSRVKHRMEHLIIQACSDSVRAELSSARVSGVLNILCKLHIIYKPGGVAERSEALKQVQHPKPADSAIDAVLKLRTWKRWMTRLSDLGGAQPDAALSLQALECITGNVLRSLPSLNLVRASLHLDTQPTGAKVSEYFEHLLVELEAVSRVAEGPSPSLSLGAKTEANKNVRQVDARVAGGNDTSPAAPKEARSPKGAGQAAGGDSPKKLCKWFHEAKGCKRGKDCKFTHDWSQVPKQDRADRCMACGAKGHRRDACPNTQGTGLAKRDDGASSAKSARADPAQKSKADPGLRKVLSDAAGVLREAIHASGGAADPAAHQPPSAGGSARGGGSEAGTCAEGPAMAAAAKIQAQLEDLEARVLDGRGPAVRAVSGAAEAVNSEQTALLDSGATHAELDVASAEGQDLVPCTVSLAGRLKTSLKGGCPQLNREQAMCLIKELERLSLTDAIDAFVGSGDYGASLDLLQLMPFLKSVPDRITTRLAVDLKAANGWELLKALPFNRRVRKRIHQSYDWLLHLSSSPADSSLKRMCCDRQVELVELGGTRGNLVSPSVWKVLCWAAFTGRVAGVVADAPMKTWGVLKVEDSKVVRLRSSQHPWGEPGITTTLQAKVDDDVLTALQPMWLWTVASLSRGEGIPTCQTHALYPEGANECWMRDVVDPFLQWSNCSDMTIDSDRGVEGNTRPMKVCTNLGLPSGVAQALQKDLSLEGGPVVHGWPLVFRHEVSMALFGGSLAAGHVLQKVPAVNAIGAEQPSSSPEAWLAQEHMQEATVAGQEGQGGADGQPEVVDRPVLDSGGASEHQQAQAEDAQPASRGLSDKEKEKWKRHIDAHHIPFRRDCLQCVMSGSLGLQHRRVKCPTMYSLAFDLTGPFVERGKDDRGGCYKYALVAGLRVPDIALPAADPKAEVGANRPTKAPKARSRPKVMQSEPPVVEDDAPSEASWLQTDLEPKEPLETMAQEEPDDEDEPESVLSWFEAPDLESLKASLKDAEEAAEDEPVGDGTEQKPSDGDPWDDDQGVSSLTDEQFDEELAQLLFAGANKVLRFVVPLKSRKGPQILAGLQEIVTECGRLGFPVKVVHTDRAKELMSKAVMDWLQSKLRQPSFTQGDDPKSNGLAERLVGWAKARARLHLASSGLGVEQWPSAMEFACAEHRHRLLQLPGRIPRFGQKVIFKSKHPTGKSKRPFVRWEHAIYLCPTPRTEGGHVLLRAASGAYLVAKNVRCLEELVDPEAELGGEEVLQADPPEHEPSVVEPLPAPAPSRRVIGKRAVRAVSLPSEWFAMDLMNSKLYTADHCGRLLDLAFGGVEGGTRRMHRGAMDFAVILGAYSHGGLKGITRASQVHPMVCRYLNEYLRRNSSGDPSALSWTALTVVVAPEVAMHRDVRNEPGSVNHVAQVLAHSNCQEPVQGLNRDQEGQEQFEARIERWQRVLGGADEDPSLHPASAVIPHALLVATVFQQRDWERDPGVFVEGPQGPVLAARVMDFSDDGPAEEGPFPDRMLMFSVHDVIRNIHEMVILRVVMVEEEPEGAGQAPQILQPPGPPAPEVRTITTAEEQLHSEGSRPIRLPVPLPNPTSIKTVGGRLRDGAAVHEDPQVFKTEAATTKDLEQLLGGLTEPPSVTHTASQEEVRANLEKWKPAIVKELQSLKKQGVLLSHFGDEARAMISNSETSVISLKGVFIAKAPGDPSEGLFKRKCRLVGCGNQTPHVDADSLYAAGVPAELVRAALVQAAHHQWSAFTTDIKAAFTNTPIPKHAAKRYMLRPPRWLVDLGLASPGEYYSLGMVLYGFKEAPAWWSEHRDSKLAKAVFGGCHLEQGESDASIWRIKEGDLLKGYLVTYVDDFLILSDGLTARNLHDWLISDAGWETDGLSEATPGSPVRFLGMQLQGYEDGHFSLDQEAYVDELVRAYGLTEACKSKIVCPKELLMSEEESAQPCDEPTVKLAQKLAGECLWLAQRTRLDISFATTVLCSRVSRHSSIAIGKRILSYLFFTKHYKLHLKPDHGAPGLRVFTDASFSPQGQHSYRGHIVEWSGVPVLWKASKQSLIALSSSESELIQAVEGCIYAESFITALRDLGVRCETAELMLDNTAAISFIGGAGNQRTRHLKVRGFKIRQLVQSGWTVTHCRGEIQKADLMTKVLSAARTRFLCDLLQLGAEMTAPEPETQEESVAVRSLSSVPATCLQGLLLLLQASNCVETSSEDGETGVAIEWPWELGIATLLVVLSTLFIWEASGAPCRRRAEPRPTVRAVNAHKKDRRSRRLQEQVAAAIDSAVSESPTGDEARPQVRRSRNKCTVDFADEGQAATRTQKGNMNGAQRREHERTQEPSPGAQKE
ncbi:Copia protein [Symbiodinium microadriaticum]|uniref:Copia protein n=1 Tax=Symbiodinium microadriaticum TaxID=2951 RepID=A0A1Q9DRD6_SYMMI|nr:Copia protein [Symbiodinium microadriaticum]